MFIVFNIKVLYQ